MSITPFCCSNDIITDAAALTQRMSKQGYLYFKQIIPKVEVDVPYQQTMQIIRELGWVDENNHIIGEPYPEGKPEYFDAYDRIQMLESFHAMAHHPNVISVVQKVVEGDVLVHPRNIARVTPPLCPEYTTPPHQDWPLIQGTKQFYTGWILLYDCPVELGGLAVLEASHTYGLLPARPALGPGGLSVTLDRIPEDRWHQQDMSAGDMLLFPSHTIHKGLPNLSKSDFRISVDYRYQNLDLPVVVDSLRPHYERASWEQIYEGWQNEASEYYWTKLGREVKIIDRDPSPIEILP